MELKQNEVTIEFLDLFKKTFPEKYIYKSVYTNIKNLDFVKCCDMLKLEEYGEFEKQFKYAYFSMDNCVIIIDTIKSNDVEHFKYILNYITIKNLEDVLCYCCKNNYDNIVEYILYNNINFNNYQKYIELSLLGGSLKLVKKYKDKIILSKDMFTNAIFANYKDCLTYLQENKCKHHKNVFTTAILNQKINSIEWLIGSGFKCNTKNINALIYSNNEEIFEIFGSILEANDLIIPLCNYGNLNTFKYIHKRKALKIKTSIIHKIQDINIVKWLLENNLVIYESFEMKDINLEYLELILQYKIYNITNFITGRFSTLLGAMAIKNNTLVFAKLVKKYIFPNNKIPYHRRPYSQSLHYNLITVEWLEKHGVVENNNLVIGNEEEVNNNNFNWRHEEEVNNNNFNWRQYGNGC